jgi:hypothetical protein
MRKLTMAIGLALAAAFDRLIPTGASTGWSSPVSVTNVAAYSNADGRRWHLAALSGTRRK